jgi:hypothetical protein
MRMSSCSTCYIWVEVCYIDLEHISHGLTLHRLLAQIVELIKLSTEVTELYVMKLVYLKVW